MAANKPSSKKYLVFSMARRKASIEHVLASLNLVFMEAARLNRIPAVGNFTIKPKQNRGFEKGDFRFEDYFDLSNSTLRRRNKVDDIIKDHQQWIKEEELDLESYASDKVCHIDNKVISQEMDECHDIVVRRDPTSKYIENHLKNKPSDALIDIPYSQKVNQLTDLVLNALNTSRENSLDAQHYFLNKVATMRSCFDEATRERGSSISLKDSYYACMHVQKEGQDTQPLLQFAVAKKQIQEVLSYAINKGTKLYVISDILSPKHFDFLKEHYKVYRYYDFPELNQLVSGENNQEIDNVMLYLVEKNIMKYAVVKILSPQKGSTMYHLNEVYDPTILKDPPRKALG